MKEAIERLLNALDEGLRPVAAPGERLDLYHIGRSVLIYHFDLAVSTRDIDIVRDRDSALQAKALELFGHGSEAADELGLYLEGVDDPLPPMPAGFKKRAEEVAGGWQVIRLWRLEWNDFAATKLSRFAPRDRADLKFLCDTGLLDAVRLRESLERAFLWDLEKDGDPIRDRAFEHLKTVQDYLAGESRRL